MQLALLLCKFHKKFRRYTDVEYYKMIDKKSFKFYNELMKNQVKKIKSQLKPITPSFGFEKT